MSSVDQQLFKHQDLGKMGFACVESSTEQVYYERDGIGITYHSITEIYSIVGDCTIYSGRITNRLLLHLIFIENDLPLVSVGEAISDNTSF